MNKFGTIAELKDVLGQLSGVKPENIIIADVYNGRFFKIFSNKESIDAIQDRDFICGYIIHYVSLVTYYVRYELSNHEDNILHLQVVQRKEEAVHYQPYGMSNYTRKALFGTPFVLSIPDPATITYKELYTRIYTHLRKYLKVPNPKVQEEAETDEEKTEEEPR